MSTHKHLQYATIALNDVDKVSFLKVQAIVQAGRDQLNDMRPVTVSDVLRFALMVAEMNVDAWEKPR